MIAVDTSVWVDVLNDNDTPQAERCAQLIEAGEPVALTDVVFTEILQGLGSSGRRAWLSATCAPFRSFAPTALRTSPSRPSSTAPRGGQE